MKSNKNCSKILILRLLNDRRVVIEEKDSSKIHLNKNWLNGASNSSVFHSSELSTGAPKDATLEFSF